MAFGVGGVESQCGRQRIPGLGELSGEAQEDPAIVMNLGQVGACLGGVVEMFAGAGGFAFLPEDHAEPGQRFGVVGIEAQPVLEPFLDAIPAMEGKGPFQQCLVVGMPGQHLEPEFAHLVGGFLSVSDASGGMVRIGGVVGGIVVAVFEMQHGALRERDGRGESIGGLPVEIPAFDPQQPLPGPVGQRGVALHFAAEEVSMRVERQDRNIDRQGHRIPNEEVGLTGRKVERIGSEFDHLAGVGGG